VPLLLQKGVPVSFHLASHLDSVLKARYRLRCRSRLLFFGFWQYWGSKYSRGLSRGRLLTPCRTRAMAAFSFPPDVQGVIRGRKRETDRDGLDGTDFICMPPWYHFFHPFSLSGWPPWECHSLDSSWFGICKFNAIFHISSKSPVQVYSSSLIHNFVSGHL
jgi:hypothetical protein